MRYSKINITHNQKGEENYINPHWHQSYYLAEENPFKSIVINIIKEQKYVNRIFKNIIFIFKKYGISKEIEMPIKTTQKFFK